MIGKMKGARVLTVLLLVLVGLLLVPLAVGATAGGNASAVIDEGDDTYPWPEPGAPLGPSLLDDGGPQLQVLGGHEGHDVYITNPTYSGWAGLFKVQIKEPDGTWGPTTYAYCTDINHGITYDHIYESCGNTNNYIAYILNNYYPKTNKPTSLSETQEKAAAVQAAIWHYADGTGLGSQTEDDIESAYYAILADTDANGASYGMGAVPDSMTLTPATASNQVGDYHTVTATVIGSDGSPMQGVTVYFEITAGPDDGKTHSGTTNASGQVSWTFKGDATGTDMIEARTESFDVPRGIRFCYPDKQMIVLAGDPTESHASAEAEAEWTCPDCTIDAPPFVCEDPNAEHTASTTYYDGVSSYNWTIQGGTITGGQGTHQITFKATAGAGATVDLQVSFRINLDSSLECHCDLECEVSVPVEENPDCTITAAGPVCEGTGNHTASAKHYAGASYTWTIQGGTIDSGQNTRQITYSASPGASEVVLGVTVETADGCEATCSKTVDVNPAPDCSIDADGAVCAGSSGNTASTTYYAGATYQWTVTGGTITGGQNTSSITYSAGSGASLKIEVTVTLNGCENHCDETVTIKPKPNCDIDADPAVCEGSLGNEASTTHYAGATYLWTVSGGALTSGQGTSEIEYTAGTGSDLTLTVKVTLNGCEKTCNVTVDIDPNPVVVAQGVRVCEDATATLEAQVTSGCAGTVNYKWYKGTTYKGSGPTLTIPNAQLGDAGTYKVVAECVATGCKAEDTCELEVDENPECDITAPDSVCEGSTGHTASTIAGYNSYDWEITGGTITGGHGTNQITFSAGTGATVYLKVTVEKDKLGCTAWCDETIIVKDKPACDIDADPAVCEGSTGNTASTPHIPGATYAWQIVGGTITSGQNTHEVTYTAGSGSSLKLTVVVTKDGCESECDETVTVKPAPDCTIQADPAVCAGTSGHTASTTDYAGATYEWTVDGGSVVGPNNGPSITYQAGSGTDLTLHVTVNLNGCEETCDKTVDVKPEPDCTIQAQGPVCAGTGGHTASTTYYPGATYEWTIDGGVLVDPVNESTVTYRAGTGTSLTLHVKVTLNGCEKTCHKTVDVTPEPDCTIDADSAVCEGSLGNTASTTEYANATYLWTVSGGTLTSGQGTHEIEYTAGSGADLTLTVVVTLNGCEAECEKTVTIQPEPKMDSTNDRVCVGEDAQLTARVVQGCAGSATFTWYKGGQIVGSGPTLDIDDAQPGDAGTYRVVAVCDATGCEGETTATLTVDPEPDVEATGDEVCVGEDAILKAEVLSGCAGPVMVKWYKGSTLVHTGATYTIHDVGMGDAGSYTAKVWCDLTGCMGEDTAVLTVHPLPVVEATGDAVCVGEEATLTALVKSGCQGASTIEWFKGATKVGDGPTLTIPSAGFSDAGEYVAKVTCDATGCKGEDTATLVVNPEPVVVAVDDTVCVGEDAELTASVTSGCDTGSISYTWYKGSTEVGTGPKLEIDNAQPSDAGTYKVVAVCDVTGCEGEDTATLVVNPEPVVVAVDDTVCVGEDAELTASVTSGCDTGSISYTWYKGSTEVGTGPKLEIDNAQPSDAGTYKVVAVCDVTGCEGEDTATLTVDPEPDVQATGDTVCVGEDATLKATILSGCDTADATFKWYKGTQHVGDGPELDIDDAQMSDAGTYKVVVTCKVSGCEGEDTATLTVHPEPVVEATGDTVCVGEEASMSASLTTGCGTGSATIKWYKGGNLVHTGATYTIPNAQSSHAGTYLIVATCDVTGCDDSTTAKLTVHPNPVVVAVDDRVCIGEKATLKASVTDGCSGSATLKWYFGGNLVHTGDEYVIPNAQPSHAGTYKVVATCDLTGCEGEDTATLSVDPEPDVKAEGDTVCVGEDATLKATLLGGCDPASATFKWYKGTVYMGSGPELDIDDAQLSDAGQYTVKVTCGVSGCEGEDTATLTVYPNPDVDATDDRVCVGEQATMVASLLSGCGTGDATFRWYKGGALVHTGDTFTILATVLSDAGDYKVVATCNVTGCEDETTATLTVDPEPVVEATGDEVCVGAKAELKASVKSGCTSGATFTWYKGTQHVGDGPILTIDSATLGDAGEYTVFAKCDVTGCEGKDTATLTVHPEPIVQATGDTVCVGEEATLRASVPSGCSGPVTFKWYKGTQHVYTGPVYVISNAQESHAGDYKVVATCDATGCEGEDTAKLVVDPLPIVVAVDDAVCVGEKATLTASVTDGCDTGSISYTWYKGVNQVGTGEKLEIPNVQPSDQGTYKVVAVCDATGCEGEDTAILTVYPNPVVEATGDEVCEGETAMLSAQLTAGCGIGNASYTWYKGAGTTPIGTGPTLTIPNAQESDEDTYKVVVVCEVSGCTDETTADLVVNPNPVVEATGDEVCEGDEATLSASLTSGCGTGGATFKWYKGSTHVYTGAEFKIPNVQGSHAGTYKVVATCDDTGCDDETTVDLVVHLNPEIEGSGDEVCEGEDATLSVTLKSGCVGTASYKWTDPTGAVVGNESTLDIPAAAMADAGTYKVVVTCDVTGCDTETTVDLVVHPNPTVEAEGDEVCEGEDATLTADGSGCESGDTLLYAWYTETGTTVLGTQSTLSIPAAQLSDAGTYKVVVTCEATGCSDETTAELIVHPNPTVEAEGDEVCEGEDATLTADGSGCESGDTLLYAWYTETGTTVLSTESTLSFPAAAMADAGTYKVVVTCEATGCSAETTAELIVHPNPTVEAEGDEVCEGEDATLTADGSGCEGDDTLLYAWYTETGTTVLSTESTLSIPAAQLSDAGIYKVVVTCEATGCSAETTAELIVHPNPTVEAEGDEVCEGEDATLTADGSGCESGDTLLYAWYTETGTTVLSTESTLSFPAATMADAGTYKVVVTCEATGCSAETTAELIVHPNPTVEAEGDEVCEGEDAELSADGTGCESGDTLLYAWYTETGTTVLSTESTLSFPAATMADAGTYKVVVTCEATGCSAETTAELVVHPNPVVETTGDEVCEGEDATLTASGSGCEDYEDVSYVWYDPTGAQVGTGPTLVIPAAQMSDAGIYKVVVTCINDGIEGCDTEATAELIVHPNPVVVTVEAQVCEGEDATLTASATGCEEGDTVSYVWYDPTGAEVGTGPTLVIPAAQVSDEGIYRVVATCDETGCDGEATASLTVWENPTVETFDVEVCEGQDATLIATGEGCVEDTMLYVWYKDGVEVGQGATLSIPGATEADEGEYTVVVTCEETGCSAEATATLTVHPYPEISCEDTEICLGDPAVLEVDISDSGDCAEEELSIAWYRWDEAAGEWQLVEGETGASLTIVGLPVGTYQYKVVVCCEECCVEDDATIVVESGNVLAIKFHDLNANGVQDDGEERLEGWTMTLSDALGNEVGSGATNANGEILFAGLECGEYLVVETMQDGWVNTTPLDQTVVVERNQTSEAHFGNFHCVAVFGHKWEDTDADGIWDDFEAPIEGWKITLSDGQTVETLADGSYWFTVCQPGEYSVSEETRDGWEPMTPEKVSFVVTSGQDVGPIDFGNYNYFYTLGSLGAKFWDLNRNGVRDDGEPGLPDVTIIIRDSGGAEVYRTQTLNAPGTPGHGAWTITAPLSPGVYTVEEVAPAGWVQTAPDTNNGVYEIRLKPDDTFELISSEPSGYDGGLNFGNARYMGFKFHDMEGNAQRDPSDELLRDWQIVIKDMDLNIVYATMTDPGGYWWLEKALPEGDYYVVEVQQAEWTQTYPENFAGGFKIHLDANGNYTLLSQQPSWFDGLNFGNSRFGGGGICPDCPEWVVFQSDRDDENFDIYRMRFDGTDVWRLTNALEDDTSPTWSFDGSRIAFASLRDGDWEVYRMGPDGGGQFNVTEYPDADDRAPSWACYWIAFQTNRDGNWEIYKTDPNGIEQIRLTEHPASDEAPAWSPDEQWIAFQTNRNGNWDIYIMDANGNNLRQLTDDPGADQNPTWSVDQQWIAFESNRDGNVSLYKMHVETGDIIRLTDEIEGSDTNAAWMPYCEYIWFQSDRDGDNEIYRMQYDGSQQTNISVEPDWFDVLDYAPPGTGVGPSVAMALENGMNGYEGCVDATLDEWAVAQARGGEHTVRVRSGGVRSAPIRFDLSSLPDGISVQSARLQMVTIEQTNSSALKVGAYALTRAWQEDETTYELAGAGDPWTTGGAEGDIAGDPADAAVLSEVGQTVAWDLTELVKNWLADPDNNYGVLLKGEDTNSVEYALVSSEHGNLDWRPQLIVVYEYTP